MLLCAEYVLPITSDPIEKGAVLVRDDKIADVGPAEQLRARYAGEEVRDFGQAALIPGLVNVHNHVEFSAMRGVVHDLPYAEWLTAVSDISNMLTSADLYDSALIGGLEAISAGVTTMGDITQSESTVHAFQKLGLRGVIYREVSAMDKRRVDYAMHSAEEDVQKWSEEVDPDRIIIGIAPTNLYECHPSVLTKVSEFAADKLPVALHVAGSREEYDFIKRGSSVFSVAAMKRHGYVEIPPWLPTGVTPVNYVLNWGGFDAENVLAIHCVHVNEEDIQKMKEYNVAVAWCPRCNAQLGMGVAPIGEYQRAGLRIGIGTDSPAASDSPDMFSEMRIGMMVQRAVNTRDFMHADTLLKMATIGGAKALRVDDKIGSLEVGKQADIVAIDLSGSHQTPTATPMSAVVHTAISSDVTMTMVAGQVLYDNGKWNVDIELAKPIAHMMRIRGKMRHMQALSD